MMQELQTLFIRMRSHADEPIEWLITTPQGNILQGPAFGPIADLKPFAQNHFIVALVPSSEILLTQVSLPTMVPTHLAQAIAYALEDDLVDDIADLHFAIGKPIAHHLSPVAVVKKKLMQHWLAQLQTVGIQPHIMLPETLALPYSSVGWHIAFTENNMALVRINKSDGFAIETAQLPDLLEKTLAETEEKPSCLYLMHYHKMAIPDLSQLSLTTEIATKSTESLLVTLTQYYSSSIDMNLLQGEFRPPRQLSQLKKQWLFAGTMAAGAICIILLSQLLAYFYLVSQHTRLEQQIAALYHTLFPQAKTIVDPRARLERELQQAQQNTQGNTFLSLLAKTGKVIHTQTIKLQSIEFRGERLTIMIQTKDFAQLQAVLKQLQAQQLTIHQEQAITEKNIVTAKLIIQERM